MNDSMFQEVAASSVPEHRGLVAVLAVLALLLAAVVVVVVVVVVAAVAVLLPLLLVLCLLILLSFFLLLSSLVWLLWSLVLLTCCVSSHLKSWPQSSLTRQPRTTLEWTKKSKPCNKYLLDDLRETTLDTRGKPHSIISDDVGSMGVAPN